MLRQRLLRNKERDNFTLRNLQRREMRHRLGVMKAKLRLAILDGHPHLIPHEVDVPLDRLAGYLQLLSHRLTVGKLCRLHQLVQA